LGRMNVSNFDASHLYSPAFSCFIEHDSQLVVDHVSRRKSVIKIQIADDRTHRRDRELHDRARQVSDFVHGFYWIGYLIVEHRVDVDRHIVASDHGLWRKLEKLFAEIERRKARPDPTPVCRTRFVEKGKDDVEPAAGHLVKLAEPLDDHHRSLSDY